MFKLILLGIAFIGAASYLGWQGMDVLRVVTGTIVAGASIIGALGLLIVAISWTKDQIKKYRAHSS